MMPDLDERFLLVILATSDPENKGWGIFWGLYFAFGDRDRFHQNYVEAWRQRFIEEQKLQISNPQNPTLQPRPNASECSVIMFRDNGRPLLIPCRWDITDQQLIRHIGNFYYLQRLEAVFLSSLASTINIIEVVRLEQRLGVGSHEYYLNLARYGSGNRLIRFWLRPSQLSGTSIVEKLTTDAVLAAPALPEAQAQAVPTLFSILFGFSSQQPTAEVAAQVAAQNQALGDHKMELNIVDMWNTEAATVIAAVPLLSSLVVGIVWAVVAITVYQADVNVSVQTGFTIASYVITTGAILIALVAYLDSQNEKVKVP
ncbi:hypothetical protein DL764_005317 [Monosporascus ibericus]|uniref:Uncharacterized protein n=1 Tax=Monosporascus ibericus TaxID=155417 RepID=A0A4Q4T9N7_9PEZI|nr:hypothetical protein DL764_005317 [Monosporascus ibericus]